MAHPLQRAAFRRKVIYAVVILGLFTVSMFWRGKLDVPFSRQVRAANWLTQRAILSQASRLELRELDQGDPEVATAAANVSVVGFRGPIITALWWSAIEKQKRNEFHEFELLVRLVIRLQPNFITPWIYQSWNIAYNVSVENDKLGDMYFYIARGIELLAEGDRLNTKIDRSSATPRRVGPPDIRFQIGFYYQNKFGVSDKVNTLRCLAQLSCIPPGDRKDELFKANGVINTDAFKAFCLKNPQLVRRLRTKLACNHPQLVIDFLKDNYRVPSLYKNDTDLAAAEDQFPVLPPQFDEGPDEFYAGKPVDDTFDFFWAARSWFAYAQTVVPPPTLDQYGDPIPWAAPLAGEYDPFKYRMPRSPALILFRYSPARAQNNLADRMTKEGWFDDATEWNPDERAGDTTAWFPGADVRLRAGTNSQAQWAKAWEMWDRYGRDNGMILPPGKRQQLLDQSGMPGGPSGNLPPQMDEEEMKARGLTKAKLDAQRALVYYDQNRSMTNFPFFLESSRAEKDKLMVSARKLLWEAAEAKDSAGFVRASRIYVQALARWREVLMAFPQFHRPERSDRTEEDTFEYEMKLIELLRDDGSVKLRTEKTLQTFEALIPGISIYALPDFRQAVAEDEALARIATESVMTVFPGLSLLPEAPEKRILGRIEVEISKVVPALVIGKPAALDPFPTELAAVRAAHALRDKGPAEKAAADAAVGKFANLMRPVIARRLVDTEFSWMKLFKYEPLDRDVFGNYERAAYWVSPETREAAKIRLGLVRRAPPPVPDGVASGELPAGQ